jgi:hypothetical protein
VDDDDVADDDDDENCASDEVEDCNGNCAPAKWLNDDFCDNGSPDSEWEGYNVDFNCAEHNFDEGDCEETGDDDDDIDPCNPPASLLNCDAPGPLIGGSGWENPAISTDVTQCDPDLIWAAAPVSRTLPPGVVSAYVGYSGGTSSESVFGYLANDSGPLATSSTNEFAQSDGGGVFDDHVAGVVMPMTPATDPLPGCIVVWPLTLSPSESGEVLFTVRPAGETDDLIHINVGLVAESGATPSNMEESLSDAANLLYEGTNEGVDLLGAWSFYTISESAFSYIAAEGSDINALRRTRMGEDDRTINLFVIGAFDESILGIAGGIPGPLGHQGTASSGTVVAVEPHLDGNGDIDSVYMAQTIVHEVGHYLGLYHTTESGGSSWDPLPDTPQCTADPTTPSACADGDNFMFWTGGPDDEQSTFSAEQSNVFVSSPIVQ